MATKAEIEVENARLKGELDSLKDNIVHIAGRAAYEHDLCHVLEDTLQEVGIGLPEPVRFTVTKKVERWEEVTYEVPLLEAYRYGLGDHDDLSDVIADIEAQVTDRWGNVFDEWEVARDEGSEGTEDPKVEVKITTPEIVLNILERAKGR